MDFNALDLILGVILLVSVFGAARNGVTKELIRIASLIVGVILAMWGHGVVGQELQAWIPNPRIASSLGFVLILFGCVLAGALAAHLLKVVWKFTGLEWLDMLLGGAFGLARGLLVCAIILVGLIAFQPIADTTTLVADSAVAPWVLDVSRTVAAAAPGTMRAAFRQGVAMVEADWDEEAAAPSEADPLEETGNAPGANPAEPSGDGANDG